jgi:drug/metabolite transporter (DMT)-like permease
MQSEVKSQDDLQGMKASGKSHRMSIATTIGATIGLIGLVLLLYGLFGNASYGQSDGININLWWGLVMLVFGLLMSAVGYISARGQRARGDTMQAPQSASPSGEQESQGEKHTA